MVLSLGHMVTSTADSADLNSEEREQMASVKARVASYIDHARAVALRVTNRELNLNQAQLCVIPICRETTSRTTRGRRS